MIILYITGLLLSLYGLVKRKRIRKPALLLLVGSLTATGICAAGWITAKDTKVHMIDRETKDGKEKTVELKTRTAEGEKNIQIKIAPQSYSLHELEQLSERLFEELQERITGNDNTLDCVTGNMYFPERLEGYPFILRWMTDQPALLSGEGKVGTDIPREGALVQICLKISCKDNAFEAEHFFYVMLYPAKEEAAFWERLKNYLQTAEQNTRDKETYLLPQSFENTDIVFEEINTDNSRALFLLSLTAALLMAAGQRQEEESRRKKRRQEMAEAYPEIVARMAMLTGAGMTISGAFRRIAGEYGKQKQKKEKPLYEELMITCREIETGIPELTAYQNMGKRCGLSSVARFAALLNQYTKSGASGLKTALSEETAQALKERRERAKRKGEEAGTKLLLPMILMLVLVMVIIMIPAVSSFGIKT